jgi:hypothetical protein
VSACQDPDDSGGTLVVGQADTDLGAELGVRRADGHRHWAGVRRVGEQRAEQDDHLHAEALQALHQLLTEGAPAHVRLYAMNQYHVAGQPGGRHGRVGRLGTGDRDPGRRPDKPLGLPALDLDYRPVDLEVVEILGIDGADWSRLPGDAQVVDHPARRLARVIPAFESGDGDRGYEFADVVELDNSPPPMPTLGLSFTAYVVSLACRVTGRRVSRGYGKLAGRLQ